MANIKGTLDYTEARSALLKTLAEGMADELVKLMVSQGWLKTCLNCHYWHKPQEKCDKYNQRPPAEIIVAGCPDHEDIPF